MAPSLLKTNGKSRLTLDSNACTLSVDSTLSKDNTHQRFPLTGRRRPCWGSLSNGRRSKKSCCHWEQLLRPTATASPSQGCNETISRSKLVSSQFSRGKKVLMAYRHDWSSMSAISKMHRMPSWVPIQVELVNPLLTSCRMTTLHLYIFCKCLSFISGSNWSFQETLDGKRLESLDWNVLTHTPHDVQAGEHSSPSPSLPHPQPYFLVQQSVGRQREERLGVSH